MKLFSLLGILLLFFSPITLSAAVIHGKITDEKGRELGFAVVFVKGTQNGVMADENGFYSISVPKGEHTLICRFTAYKPEEKKIVIQNDSAVVNFRMIAEKLTLKEVTIRANGEDPAVAMMRKVIARRKFHESLIKTRETDIYLKGNIHVIHFDSFMGRKIEDSTASDLGLDSARNGIVYLLEEVSHYTYQAPDKEFNKVLSVRQSGDPHGLGFATMPPVLNIYHNNIDLLGINKRGFISPANSDAFHYYNFHYLGSFQQYGRTIDKIQVTPKRTLEPCFTGVVYVAEDDWVFQSVNLFLTKSAQITGLDTVRLIQNFQPINKDLWIIQNQILSIRMRLLGIKFGGSFLTVYQNQKVNQPVDEKLFSGKTIAAYDSMANKKDSAYWADTRPVPLSKVEQRNFEHADSSFFYKKIFSDSSKKALHYQLGLFTFLAGNPNVRFRNNQWSMRPLFTSVQYNTVEGLNATLDLTWKHTFRKDTSLVSTVQWLNRYGFQNNQFNSLIHFSLRKEDPHWQQKYMEWELSAGKYVYQINAQNPIMPVMNEVYTLFSGDNYLKLYESRLVKLQMNRDWGNGISGGLGFEYEKRSTLNNSTNFTFRSDHDPKITPNEPFGKLMLPEQNAFLVSFKINFQPGVRYIQYPDFKKTVFQTTAPTFSFNYTEGIPLAAATADFSKWKLSMEHQINMRLAGHLNYHLAAGGFLWKQEVNLPDWNHINGDQTILAGPFLNSFQLAPYYRFSNLASFYGEGHLEWHLNGLFTNKIPLFRRLNWFLVSGTNALFINKNDYYAEAFVGLENIGFGLLRFGRIDFIAGYVSQEKKPSLGVRISLGGVFNKLLGTQSPRNL